MNARLSWTLIVVLLCASQVQAWHAPSHIDDYSGLSVHQEASCILGVNGHGVALPPAIERITPSVSRDAQLPPLSSFFAPPAGVVLLPPLRGPPGSSAFC